MKNNNGWFKSLTSSDTGCSYTYTSVSNCSTIIKETPTWLIEKSAEKKGFKVHKDPKEMFPIPLFSHVERKTDSLARCTLSYCLWALFGLKMNRMKCCQMAFCFLRLSLMWLKRRLRPHRHTCVRPHPLNRRICVYIDQSQLPDKCYARLDTSRYQA